MNEPQLHLKRPSSDIAFAKVEIISNASAEPQALKNAAVALILVIGVAFGAWLVFFLLNLRPGAVLRTDPMTRTIAGPDLLDTSIASPSFDPVTVVNMQLESLRLATPDPHSLVQCYSLASPANRLRTGPISRFASMLTLPGYRPLLNHASAMAGEAAINNDQATVLVTIVAADSQIYAYEFLLNLQNPDTSQDDSNLKPTVEGQPDAESGELPLATPFAGCWMTDAVLPVLTAPVIPVAPLAESKGAVNAE